MIGEILCLISIIKSNIFLLFNKSNISIYSLMVRSIIYKNLYYNNTGNGPKSLNEK